MKLDNQFSSPFNEAEYLFPQQISALNASQKARFQKLLEIQERETSLLKQRHREEHEKRVQEEARKLLEQINDLSNDVPLAEISQLKAEKARTLANETVRYKEELESEQLKQTQQREQQRFLDNPHIRSGKQERQDSYTNAAKA